MFIANYFAARFFAARYFAEVGANPASGSPGRAAVRITGQKRGAAKEATL